jgi:hypothetical protein
VSRFIKICAWLALTLGAFSGVFYYGFLRSYTHELEPELNELRSLGIATTYEELEEQDKGLTPYSVIEKDVAEVMRNSSFHAFLGASAFKDVNTRTELADPAEAYKRLIDMDPEFKVLMATIKENKVGYRFDLKPGLAPSSANQKVSLLGRKLRIEVANNKDSDAVETALPLLRLADQLCRSGSQSAQDSGNRLGRGALQELVSSLAELSDSPAALNALERGTREQFPPYELLRLRSERLVSSREYFRRVNPIREVLQGLMRGTIDKSVSVKKLLQRERKLLQDEIATVKSIKEADGDIDKLEQTMASNPANKARAIFYTGYFKELRRTRLDWAFLRAGLFVLQHREKTGSLPVALDASKVPADPITRQPLRYIVQPDGFVLYSPGADGDQGGLELPQDQYMDRQDIVVRVKL